MVTTGTDGGRLADRVRWWRIALDVIDLAPHLHRDADASFRIRLALLRNFRLCNFLHPGHPHPLASRHPCNAIPSPGDVIHPLHGTSLSPSREFSSEDPSYNRYYYFLISFVFSVNRSGTKRAQIIGNNRCTNRQQVKKSDLRARAISA